MIYFILALTISLTLLEFKFGDMPLPKVRYWWPRVFSLQILVILTITFGVDSWTPHLAKFQILNLDETMSPFWGGVFSYFIGSFLFYWWHRARHESPLLWRVFHQIHHSPVRVQAITAFYVHPAEAVASSLLNCLLVYCVLGLGAEALAWNGFFMALAGVFYHMNLPSPHFVGWFVQRPEMHRYHHETNIHARNYSDLPIWDMIFGTYYNPPTFHGVCGFENERELSVAKLLLAEDVHLSETLIPTPASQQTTAF